MLNVLSTTTYDPAGYVEIQAVDAQTAGATTRRVNRVQTMDGGSVPNDFGFTDADRTIELAWRSRDVATDNAVDRLLRLYSQVQIATRAGVYLAALETFTPGADESRLRLLVLSKLSE